mgnify:CR=1 FL=1
MRYLFLHNGEHRRLVRLAAAVQQKASDIHLKPGSPPIFRIDGVLHDVHLIPRMVYQAVLSRIKLLSGCDLAEKRRAQALLREREARYRSVFSNNLAVMLLYDAGDGR